VTLNQALGVDHVTARWIAEQWLTDRGYSLPTPIGMTDTGPVTLDLVEHGPHGLIGGTSGAGKSELVQSLVANLIALNSPERVNILFIDYKGGALSGLFRDVPHCVGAVTNLDALLSLRALTSLKAELDGRMALFERKGVKDIRDMLAEHPGSFVSCPSSSKAS
jgi:DNA segregation ATPase FtsK/SpoIIIE, S-DNA-T family